MKKTQYAIGIFVVSIVIILSGFNPILDGNGWRGPSRDGKVAGFKAPVQWPAQLKKVWQTKVGLGDASPVMVGNKMYLHTKQDSSEVVLCLDAGTGEILWNVVSNRAPEVTGGAASHPGPRSTPNVVDGKIFTIGAGGYFTCRNANNGQLIWKTDAYNEVPQFFVSVSPLVTDNKVIAHLNGKEKGVIAAFNINTGELIWKLEGKPATYASPILMNTFNNMIVVQAETSLLGISTDKGELLWEKPTFTETRFYNSSTPIINGKNVIIAGQGSGARSLEIKSEGGKFTANEVWKNTEFGVSFNTPVLKNGYLYGNDARFGYLFCLNAETGAKCWADTVKNNRFAAVIDLGDVLISLPSTGELIIFKPNNNSYSQIARYKVADSEVYAHPVVAGNKLFVKDRENITCWSVE